MTGELIKAGEVLKIGGRLEFYVGDDDTRYPSRIEDITENSIMVALPYTSKRVPVIPYQGERLYALAVGDRCRYRFFSTWQGTKMLDGNIPVWVISKPEKVTRFQNRRFVRIRVSQRVRVSLISEEGTIEEPFYTYTVDLSGSGICFVTEKPIAAGIQAALFIYDVPAGSNMDVMSRIVHCTKIENAVGDVVYYVGAQFEHMSRPAVNKLVRYLFGVQRKDIAKGIRI